MKNFFAADIYVKIHPNKIEIKNISASKEWETAHAEKAFTTTRLLVGSFSEAEPLLTKLMKKAVSGRLLKNIRALVQPMDKVEGGLSEIEDRIFKELAVSAGARSVVVHIGAELTDDDAISKINGA